MTRQPPALALWLLRHLGPRYRNESLEGDLFEQYQREASHSWYWQQTTAAVMLAGANWVRTRLARIVTTSSLRRLAGAAVLLGPLVLTQQYRQACAYRGSWDPTLLVIVAAAIALIASIGFYLSLCVRRFRRDRSAPRQAPYRPMLAAFLITALSAGTLTWASTQGVTHCGTQLCTCSSPEASATASQSTSAPSSIR
jgi:uncharacterized membrane protein YhaH (DUF805 family)